MRWALAEVAFFQSFLQILVWWAQFKCAGAYLANPLIFYQNDFSFYVQSFRVIGQLAVFAVVQHSAIFQIVSWVCKNEYIKNYRLSTQISISIFEKNEYYIFLYFLESFEPVNFLFNLHSLIFAFFFQKFHSSMRIKKRMKIFNYWNEIYLLTKNQIIPVFIWCKFRHFTKWIICSMN